MAASVPACGRDVSFSAAVGTLACIREWQEVAEEEEGRLSGQEVSCGFPGKGPWPDCKASGEAGGVTCRHGSQNAHSAQRGRERRGLREEDFCYGAR